MLCLYRGQPLTVISIMPQLWYLVYQSDLSSRSFKENVKCIDHCQGIRTRTSSKGRYLRKLFPKIGLGLGFGDLSSETISEDTYLCWMSECELPLSANSVNNVQYINTCMGEKRDV